MKFYITHYTPLTDRRPHIIHQLESVGIYDYTFILVKDREVLTPEELSKFNKITPGEISLFYKHLEVYQTAPENEIIVIFEDDVFLCNEFLHYLNICLTELQNEPQWDALFAGDCCNLHCTVDPGRMTKRTDGSRATGLTILNSGVGKRLYDIFAKQEKIDLPIDWWLNEIVPNNDLWYYWSEPPLAIQGSANGSFRSSLR
jgi:glycosyl transferase family 25